MLIKYSKKEGDAQRDRFKITDTHINAVGKLEWSPITLDVHAITLMIITKKTLF